MVHTESYFGLQEIDGKITGDDGKTYYPKYRDMSTEDFNCACYEVEYWLGRPLSDQDVADLKEIFS